MHLPLPIMSSTDYSLKTSATKKLEQDTVVSFAPDRAKHRKYSSHSSIPPADAHLNRPLDTLPSPSSLQSTPVSVASAVVKMLEEMGVQYAFGVSGSAIEQSAVPFPPGRHANGQSHSSSTHCNIVQSKCFSLVTKHELRLQLLRRTLQLVVWSWCLPQQVWGSLTR
ncbi:hypothetical protein WA1_25035 [Scytonema hofmannii PCC 7110]|uniref:Uncharacterized protein n=1 Tax=Scytonema hofmannii PCC 7110 TaxID=128403 RepID=A0A139X852_9CYAN|nr:hypothetical protein WA1_25035 [Scytonema hofmannii PCC 7110]